ncbi:proline/glycine betaine transporter [compost metagenome]
MPIYKGLMHYGNPALEAAIASAPVVLTAPKNCGNCDIIRNELSARGVPYRTDIDANSSIAVTIGANQLAAPDKAALVSALSSAGYPAKADVTQVNKPMMLLLLVLLMTYVTMVYGPMAAFLVELFPARIRYTSMSLPYHLGNGCFGGFLPLISSWLVMWTGNVYAGLYYPIGIALMTCIVGFIYVRETKNLDLNR